MALPPAPDQYLYNGADLANAVTRSTVRSSAVDRLHGFGNALEIFSDVVCHRLKNRRGSTFEFVTASGHAPDGERALTAAYAGTGANRAWCLTSAFTEYRETEVRPCRSARQCVDLLAEVAQQANFLFVDGVPRALLDSFDRPFLRMPAWVKQRLRIERDWMAQVASMRRGTRQEIARILRRYGYECRLTRARSDFEHFYSRLYVPYVTGRFGEGAVLVDKPCFLNECRRGTLLQLLHDQAVVGGALLRRVGDTMAIVWSALNPHPAAAPVRGLTDTMDYFSVLFAHLKACRWLDFGPSRPDLFDGALRYKRKWGAQITSGLVPQPTLAWSCGGHDRAEAEFLSRHVILQHCDGKLVATAFVAGDLSPENLRTALQLLSAPGIARRRIVALSPFTENARDILADFRSDVAIHETRSILDAIAAGAG